jgi:hypothetical protein
MVRQPRLHSPSKWYFTKQTQNKRHLHKMASFFRLNTKRQHKDNKYPHIIKDIWHIDKTIGYIEIHWLEKILHGMVKSLTTFACGGSFTGLTRIQKGFPIIPHGRNLSLDLLRIGTPQREGLSCWLIDVRVTPDDWTSRIGEQPCEIRHDVHALVMYACQWRFYTDVQDQDYSDSPLYFSILLDYIE